MNRPDATALAEALEITWPPVRAEAMGPATFRFGAGGGKRVSAANVTAPFTEADLDGVETRFRAGDEAPLFRIGPGEETLDALLEARGYRRVDPTLLYVTPAGRLIRPDQVPLDAIASEGCLGIMADIWAAGGIGPARLAVMDRAPGPKAWILGRKDDRAAGAGFVALAGPIAMVHALETLPRFRRRGVGRAMLSRAASWAVERGATHLGLAVTEGNTGANALYRSLGMEVCGGYHYRKMDVPANHPAPEGQPGL